MYFSHNRFDWRSLTMQIELDRAADLGSITPALEGAPTSQRHADRRGPVTAPASATANGKEADVPSRP